MTEMGGQHHRNIHLKNPAKGSGIEEVLVVYVDLKC